MQEKRQRPFSSVRPRWTSALLLAVCVFSPQLRGQGQGQTEPVEPQRRRLPVIAYVPEYRMEALDLKVGETITDLIFFSIEPRPNGDLDVANLSPAMLEKLHTLKKRYKTRLLVALGGWERSKGFAAVALNRTARERFAANLTRFCVDHQLDGADMDWEHPANPAENREYAKLLAELKHAFQPRGLLLTVALADWQDPGVDAYQAVDRIHVMAYDHDGPRHSTLEQAKADLETFASRGVPKEKICLGLPFYGRGMKDSKAEATYAEIVQMFHPPREADEVGGFYFNGIDTIQRKTRHTRDQGFGGVMIWEIGQDAAGPASLLRAINEEVSK